MPAPGLPPGRRLLPADPYAPRRIAVHASLFALTVLTTLVVGAEYNAQALRVIEVPVFPFVYIELAAKGLPALLDVVRAGLPYSGTLMAILLCHEMGHFIAGRVHRVRLSLPYFIPVPIALGTFGALIAMPPLESRKKLIDVGAAGPIAGLVVSTVTMAVGLSLSEVRSVDALEPGTILFVEGQSLYYMALKLAVVGPIPPGHDVFLHPIAWASWIGFLVTMLNLIPVGQLDGGHVAYALFGERQNRYSRLVHLGLLGVGLAVSGAYALAAAASGAGAQEVATQAQTGFPWFVWAGVLYLIWRIRRSYHPPAPDPTPIGSGRIALGIACIVVLVLLFMPVPLRVVQL
jgi:membrane-associated protease RseP (regulator of RpoE activity)